MAPARHWTSKPPRLREVGLRWYIENIATDLYASYHRYTPGRPVNWRFLAAQQRVSRPLPTMTAALFREPSLQDPELAETHSRSPDGNGHATTVLSSAVLFARRRNRHRRSAAFWDFDLSPVSLAGFRTWLRTGYGSLAALNAEWGTAYANWDAIQPETTRQTMRRTDDNFAPWNDFKAWMDTSFADALRFGTDAVHRADPTALSAIEGGRSPAGAAMITRNSRTRSM